MFHAHEPEFRPLEKSFGYWGLQDLSKFFEKSSELVGELSELSCAKLFATLRPEFKRWSSDALEALKKQRGQETTNDVDTLLYHGGYSARVACDRLYESSGREEVVAALVDLSAVLAFIFAALTYAVRLGAHTELPPRDAKVWEEPYDWVKEHLPELDVTAHLWHKFNVTEDYERSAEPVRKTVHLTAPQFQQERTRIAFRLAFLEIAYKIVSGNKDHTETLPKLENAYEVELSKFYPNAPNAIKFTKARASPHLDVHG